MKHLRFQTSVGSFTSDLFTSEGNFIGGDTAEAEAKAVAAHKATLEAAHRVPLSPVMGESDPWDGKSALVTAVVVKPPPPPDPDAELAKAIAAATDLAGLKAALLGNRGAGVVKGRPV